MSLGKQIKKTAIDVGMSLTAVREKAGISQKHFSRIVNDQTDPSVDMLRRICRALDVEPNVILEWDKESAGKE
jgi:DNA-binding Xre family transcriptional regulator